MKVTLVKAYRERKTQRIMDIELLLESMKTERVGRTVTTMRYYLQNTDPETRSVYMDKVPKMIFTASFKKVNGEQVMMNYNGMVLLEVNRLAGMDEAAAVRRTVSELPQTLAAFIGASGKSVKILVPFSRPDGTLPQTKEEAEMFQAHAYRWAVKLYQGQLFYKITLKRPSLEQSCRFSYDPELYFNPDALPIHQQQPVEMPTETTYQEAMQAESDPFQRLLPGYERSKIVSTLFETSLFATINEEGGFKEEEDLKPFLTTLATHCFKSGIPEEDAVKYTFLHLNLKQRDLELRQTFHNVYLISSNFSGKPCIRPEQVTAVQTDEFMKRRYQFRYNTQTMEIEYRERNSFFFDFCPITDRVLNSIALNALGEGLQLWDRDVKRYVNSDRTPLFSPVEDYLSHLPKWDGKDHIRQLADNVPCDNLLWGDFFHRWFLCMVAHWRGIDKQHANSTSPLLIGPQGTGKSTFCLRLLPSELQTYYTDSIDFSHKRDAELYLNRFALINIDEFDQVSANHQSFLKHILQKPVVNTRKPHQASVRELRRYASFIATSNHRDLLTDDSGSRRFICIQVTGKIVVDQLINHPQLYAQALEEIKNGERYWFDAKEEAIVTKNNHDFEQLPPAEQLFQQYFRGAEEGETSEKQLAVEILERLQKKSGFKLSSTKIMHFGRILNKLNIPCKKASNGMYYYVMER